MGGYVGSLRRRSIPRFADVPSLAALAASAEGPVVTISLRFRQSQFKGPIWTLSEVISSSLASLSHSFIRCLTVRLSSAGQPGSAWPATCSQLGSVWLSLVRRRMESSPKCSPAWPGPAWWRKGYSAVTAARLRLGWNTIVKVGYKLDQYVRPLSTLSNSRQIFCVILFDI